jgi:hypothetical protein
MSAGHTPAKQPLETPTTGNTTMLRNFLIQLWLLYIRVAWVKEFSRDYLCKIVEMGLFFRFRESELTSIITAQI